MREILSDLGEFIKFFNPFYGYRLVYEDPRTKYPNERALRKDLKKYGKSGGSLAMYTADLFALNVANDDYSYDVGNDLILLQLRLLEGIISDFGEVRVYREGGDEAVAIVRGVSQRDAGEIHTRLMGTYQLLNRNKGSNFPDELLERDVATGGNLSRLADKLLIDSSLPSELSVFSFIGFSFSSGGKDVYKILDESREKTRKIKEEFYRKRPELDQRKNRPINNR